MNFILSFCIGLLLQVLTVYEARAETAVPEVAPPESRFVRTATALADATDSERSDFASIALAELAVSYQAEADLARHQSLEGKPDRKLGSWSAAVYGFVDQLVLVQEDIELGFPVELRQLYAQVIGVVTGGRTVILSHPREDQQAAYEQRVLADFCARHDCQRLTSMVDGEEPEPIPVTAEGPNPAWDFRESGPACSHRGISLQFATTANLGNRRAICRQLMQEAETLAAELAWQRRHGVVIDWPRLSMQATPLRPEHIVTLNQAGDSILVAAPLFYRTPDLLRQLTPWLRQRYDGDHQAAVVELQAADLGWD